MLYSIGGYNIDSVNCIIIVGLRYYKEPQCSQVIISIYIIHTLLYSINKLNSYNFSKYDVVLNSLKFIDLLETFVHATLSVLYML